MERVIEVKSAEWDLLASQNCIDLTEVGCEPRKVGVAVVVHLQGEGIWQVLTSFSFGKHFHPVVYILLG